MSARALSPRARARYAARARFVGGVALLDLCLADEIGGDAHSRDVQQRHGGGLAELEHDGLALVLLLDIVIVRDLPVVRHALPDTDDNEAFFFFFKRVRLERIVYITMAPFGGEKGKESLLLRGFIEENPSPRSRALARRRRLFGGGGGGGSLSTSREDFRASPKRGRRRLSAFVV